MRIDLIRVEKSADGTFGVLKLNGHAFCVTLEPEDRNNEVNVSCIPEGVYLCKRVISPKFGVTFTIEDVPKRSHILFHAGNFEGGTNGCVLLGQYFGKLRGNRCILNSGNTFKAFMEILEGESYLTLNIVSAV